MKGGREKRKRKRKTLTEQPFSEEKEKIGCKIRTLPQRERCMFYQNAMSKNDDFKTKQNHSFPTPLPNLELESGKTEETTKIMVLLL